jgi:hypothetical protein
VQMEKAVSILCDILHCERSRLYDLLYCERLMAFLFSSQANPAWFGIFGEAVGMMNYAKSG